MKNKYTLKIVTIVGIFTTFLVCLSTSIIAQTDTVSSPTRWHNEKVSITAMNERIDVAAAEYKEYAPIPRGAFYDIGYPKDSDEFNALDGYSVLLVSTVSQNKDELPLKRVYILIDGKEIELKKFKEIFYKESDSNNQVLKTFGAYRVDTLYFIPAYMTRTQSVLLIDFAKNRDGMKLASFTKEVPKRLQKLPNTMPIKEPFLTDAMKKFVDREYPSFLDK